MMNHERVRPEAAGRDRANQTRQWVLIGVLSVVLVGALCLPPAEEQTAETTAPAPTQKLAAEGAARPDATSAQPVAGALSEELTRVRLLPRVDLERIVALNPMAAVSLVSPTAQPEPEPAGSEQQARSENALPATPQPSRPARPVRVQAVYGSGRGAAALVEQQIVRPGEPLFDGRRVLEVSRHGVRVGHGVGHRAEPVPRPREAIKIPEFRSD